MGITLCLRRQPARLAHVPHERTHIVAVTERLGHDELSDAAGRADHQDLELLV
jgi:hypothetical protein